MSAGASLEVGALAPEERDAAVGVLARGMRDNPIHVAVLGPDSDRRERALRRLFAAMFAHMDQRPLCARRQGEIVGVCGRLPPGACRPALGQSLRMLPALGSLGPRTFARAGRWIGDWGRRDPSEAHDHLGPVGVDRPLQGQGIGSAMLAVNSRQLDSEGVTGWLETDKRENVRFYQRFGYAVVEEAEVLGVPNWFMRREAAGHG